MAAEAAPVVETAISTEAFQDIEMFPTKCTQVPRTGLHQFPKTHSQLESRPAKFFPVPETPLPALPKSLPADGTPFSPLGVVMGVSWVYQALAQVAPQYLWSQLLPKEVSTQAKRLKDRMSWGVDGCK